MSDISQPVYTQIELYKPLIIKPEQFLANYEYPIADFVDYKPGGNGKKDIPYLSYSHAFRIFRQQHPGWEVACAVNPATGGVLFTEVDRLSYFIKSYIHDGERRSEAYYCSLLSMSNQGLHPDDTRQDKYTNKQKLVVDSALVGKAAFRAKVKAIALFTGIGLKLWTGEDLADEMIDKKMKLIARVEELASKLETLTGEKVTEAFSFNHMSSEAEIVRLGGELKERLTAVESGSMSPAKTTKATAKKTKEDVAEEALAS